MNKVSFAIALITVVFSIGFKGLPPLETFAASVFVSKDAHYITGIYAESVFALPVVQQPKKDSGWISLEWSNSANGRAELTQIYNPSKNGQIIIGAHNNLSGSFFANMNTGKLVTVIYGDGTREAYRIAYGELWQMKDPKIPSSNFRKVISSYPNEDWVTSNEFWRWLSETKDNSVVFLTCYANKGDYEWGRYFVVARKVNGHVYSETTYRR